MTQLVALIYWIHIAIREWRGADENNDEEEERAQVIIAEVPSVFKFRSSAIRVNVFNKC